MNSHVNISTGVAPVDIVFAGQVNLNEGRLFPHREPTASMPVSNYISEIPQRQETLLQIAEKNQNSRYLFHLAKSAHQLKQFLRLIPLCQWLMKMMIMRLQQNFIIDGEALFEF